MWSPADVVDGVLEATVAPSYTRIGAEVRSRLDHWDDVPERSVRDRVVLLTGATSGLGRAAAARLAEAGATLLVVGRDRGRTERAAAQLGAGGRHGRVEPLVADMGDLDAVRALAEEVLADHPRVDVLVHNAGALTPRPLRSPQGIETTVAAQVLGPFLLTTLLLPALRAAAPGRVITMSSGGMYLSPLVVDPHRMGEDPRGTTRYARAKRAQVTLNEEWARRVDPSQVVFHAVHPGWADTPGVATSLPTFRRVLGPLLRTPEQGADTLVWLATSDEATRTSGGFWMDRRERPIHRSATTRRSDAPDRRRALWDACERVCGLAAPAGR